MTFALFYVGLCQALSKLQPTGTFIEAELSLAVHIIFGLSVVYAAWLWKEAHESRRALAVTTRTRRRRCR